MRGLSFLFMIFGLFFQLALSGCGDGASETNRLTSSYSYCYAENCPEAMNAGTCPSSCSSGCTTGVQNFTSMSDECTALENSALNQGCAADLRAQSFQELGCPGTFKQF